MKTKTAKQSQVSKSMESCFRAMKVGAEVKFCRGECVITWRRGADGMTHHYPGGMHYGVSFRDGADWFTEDDGKGGWVMMHGETTKQLPGGRVWNRRDESGVPGWEDAEMKFDILEGKGFVVLVSFDHDPLPGDTSGFWRKRFRTVKEAMEYAEMM